MNGNNKTSIECKTKIWHGNKYEMLKCEVNENKKWRIECKNKNKINK